jgi:hypothetical protein
MRYLVKSRIVIVDPFEDTPVIASAHRFKFSALAQSRMMNKLNKEFIIQWYVLDTKTMKKYV